MISYHDLDWFGSKLIGLKVIMPMNRTPEKRSMEGNDETQSERRKTRTLERKGVLIDDNCGKCSKYVKEGIACEDCTKWYHAKCQNVKQSEIEYLNAAKDTTCIWICDKCKNIRKKEKEEIEKITKENEEMKVKINEIENYEETDKQLQQYAQEKDKLEKEKAQLVEENLKLTKKLDDNVKEVKKKEAQQSCNQQNTINDITDVVKEVMSSFSEQAKKDRNMLTERMKEIETEVKKVANEDSNRQNNDIKNIVKELMITFTEEARKEREIIMRKINEVEREVKNVAKEPNENQNTMTSMFKEMLDNFSEQARKDRELVKEELKMVVVEQKQEITNSRKKIVEDLREEINEEFAIREKRNKVIMFNISESHGEGREKDQQEMDKVMDVIRDGIKIEKVQIKEIRRIGTEQERKDRPIMVELENSEKNGRLLRMPKI